MLFAVVSFLLVAFGGYNGFWNRCIFIYILLSVTLVLEVLYIYLYRLSASGTKELLMYTTVCKNGGRLEGGRIDSETSHVKWTEMIVVSKYDFINRG